MDATVLAGRPGIAGMVYMIAGDYFVTPHAVRQFQERIHHRSYNDALAAIIRGLQHPTTRWIEQEETGEHPQILKARVQEPFCFRAIVRPQAGRNPAVVTILRSGKRKKP